MCLDVMQKYNAFFQLGIKQKGTFNEDCFKKSLSGHRSNLDNL